MVGNSDFSYTMLTSSDLRFYGFEDGVPVERWRSGPSADQLS